MHITTTKLNRISNKILNSIQNKETKEEDYALSSANLENCSQAIIKTLKYFYKNKTNFITIAELVKNYFERLLEKKKQIFNISRNV